jgi:Putative peptidoglycan binding domain
MKTNNLFGLIAAALVSLSQAAWAGPHGGGGGFSGGGHLGGNHLGSNPGGIRAAPAFSGGARFSGRSLGGLSRGPQQFSYYDGARTSAVRPHGFTGSVSRSVSPYAGSRTAITHQPSRAGSTAARNGVSDRRMSRATNRGSFNTNHAFARHDANWHRDWNKRRAHFDQGNVFVFVNGFWYGFYPWDYLPYYGYYPYDYYGYPYGYYDSSDYYPYDYEDQSAYGDSDQYGSNATISAVQSQLAKLGYYGGAIDGLEGGETQAALARYQQDHDLSVTGTLTPATLQSLGLARTAG